MTNDLLLLSSSSVQGQGYLQHALEAVTELLNGRLRVHFIPYALADHAAYANVVATAFQKLGVEVIGLHTVADPLAEIEQAEVLFVGGGNSFRLLQRVQRLGLIEAIRRRVASGELRYMGASAGSNLACPTIRTTNDMPIVQPASLEACALIPFQINPHYQDPDPAAPPMGETRPLRIRQFLEENDVPVLGMRDGAWLRRRGDSLSLEGVSGARLFRRGAEETEYQPGSDLSYLLSLPARFDLRA